MDKKSKLIKECELCGNSAKIPCFECRNYYCEKCYKYIHDIPKNSKHQKEGIDPFIPIDIKCPEHPEHPIFLFCVDEKGNIIKLILL